MIFNQTVKFPFDFGKAFYKILLIAWRMGEVVLESDMIDAESVSLEKFARHLFEFFQNSLLSLRVFVPHISGNIQIQTKKGEY